jgi:hypothetical protein
MRACPWVWGGPVKLWRASPIWSKCSVRLSQEYSRRPELGSQITLRPYNIDKEWSGSSRKICVWTKMVKTKIRYQFWGQTGENHPSGFEAQPLTNRRPWFWGSTKKPALLISTCTVQTAHSATRPLDRSATEYPNYATIPGPLHQVCYFYHDPHRSWLTRIYPKPT